MPAKPNLAAIVYQLHRELRDRVRRTGLRSTGRLLGDTPDTNREAMRLHRMLRSPAALSLAPFHQVLRLCRILRIPVRA